MLFRTGIIKFFRNSVLMVRIWMVILAFFLGLYGLWKWEKYEVQKRETQYDSVIAPIAEAEGVDPLLVRALIWRESRFNPLRKGAAKERGLMQVTPNVVIEWAHANKMDNPDLDDLFKPRTNITIGTWYLAKAIHHWKNTDDPILFGLGEYNAGRTNALRWVDSNDPASSAKYLNHIDYPGTRSYIQVVVDKYEQYRLGYFAISWELAFTKFYNHMKRLYSGQ